MGDSVILSRNRLHSRRKDVLSRHKISQLGLRKPHVAFIEKCLTDGVKRSHAWKELRQLARDTKGSRPSGIPWSCEVYVKQTQDPDVLAFRNEPFSGPGDPAEKVGKEAFFLRMEQAGRETFVTRS